MTGNGASEDRFMILLEEIRQERERVDRRFEEQRRESDRRFEESNRRFDAMLAKIDRVQTSINRKIAAGDQRNAKDDHRNTRIEAWTNRTNANIERLAILAADAQRRMDAFEGGTGGTKDAVAT